MKEFFLKFKPLLADRDSIKILKLIENYYEVVFSTAPWFWYVLNYIDIFDQSEVDYLLTTFSGRFLEDKIKIPLKVRIDKLDVFQFLLHLTPTTNLYDPSQGEGLKTEFYRAEHALGQLDLSFYKLLLGIIEDQNEGGVAPLRELIEERISQLSPFAKRPSHLISSPTKREVIQRLKTLYGPARQRYVSRFSLNLDRLKLSDLDQLYSNPFLIPVIRQNHAEIAFRSFLGRNGFLNSLFGPINLPRDPDLSSESDLCSVFGGCRMFLCNCLEPDDDGLDAKIGYPFGWFLGYCELCLKRIEKISYSLRMPRIGGSWSGCYCSIDCLRSDVRRVNLVLDGEVLESEIQQAVEASSIIPRELIFNLESKLRRHPIYDGEVIEDFDYGLPD